MVVKCLARKNRRKTEVLPESPAALDTADGNVVVEEETVEKPTLTEAKIEEDPRYLVLKGNLKHLVDTSPPFENVKNNPWLYLEWRSQIQRLVQ